MTPQELEDYLECVAERKMDILDKLYLVGKISEHQYYRAVKQLDEWVTNELANRLNSV